MCARKSSLGNHYQDAIKSFAKSLNFKGNDCAYMESFLGNMVQNALGDGSLAPPKEKSSGNRITLLATAATIMTQFMTEEAVAATSVEVTGQVVHVYTVDKAPHQHISITTQPTYGRVEVDQQKGTITYYPDENHQTDVYEFELSDDAGMLLFFGLGLLGLGGSFALTSGGDGKDMQPSVELDFGDAPNGLSPDDGITVFSFPTLLADNGARHAIVPGVFLGDTPPDQEDDGQPTFTALGDDNNNIDDEDVPEDIADIDFNIFTNEFSITYKASTPGFVSIWIDFNGDGDWNDTEEWFIQAEAITPAADGSFTVTVILTQETVNTLGQSVNDGKDIYSRIRFSTDQDSIMTPFGFAPDGEVEDFILFEGTIDRNGGGIIREAGGLTSNGETEYFSLPFVENNGFDIFAI